MLTLIISFFDRVKKLWDHPKATKLISLSLLLSFFIGLVISCLSYFPFFGLEQKSLFLSIELAFTVLLIFEILGLVFVLPKSVSSSVGKQFEILSIILLRSAFKEFGEVTPPITWEYFEDPTFYYMFVDAFGALVIFAIIGIYYRMQKHERITSTDEEQQNFIRFKKLIATFLLVVFFGIGIIDLFDLISSKHYHNSFNTFYLFLIFSDVLILLYSIRFSDKYVYIFRYSSFTFSTILIRFALSADQIINVIIGIISGLFVVGLSYLYNFFRNQE